MNATVSSSSVFTDTCSAIMRPVSAVAAAVARTAQSGVDVVANKVYDIRYHTPSMMLVKGDTKPAPVAPGLRVVSVFGDTLSVTVADDEPAIPRYLDLDTADAIYAPMSMVARAVVQARRDGDEAAAAQVEAPNTVVALKPALTAAPAASEPSMSITMNEQLGMAFYDKFAEITHTVVLTERLSADTVASRELLDAIKPGKQARSVTDDGCKVIFTGTPMGIVTVVEIAGKEGHFAALGPISLKKAGMLNVTEDGELPVTELQAVLGTVDGRVPNIGKKLLCLTKSIVRDDQQQQQHA